MPRRWAIERKMTLRTITSSWNNRHLAADLVAVIDRLDVVGLDARLLELLKIIVEMALFNTPFPSIVAFLMLLKAVAASL